MGLNNPKNHQVLEGKWGLAGSIAETSLAGGAAATAVAWLCMVGWTEIWWVNWLRIFMTIIFIDLTMLMGVRVLEQVNYFCGNPGVSEENSGFVKNEGLVPFKRAWIAVVSVLIFYAISLIFVLIAVKGF